MENLPEDPLRLGGVSLIVFEKAVSAIRLIGGKIMIILPKPCYLLPMGLFSSRTIEVSKEGAELLLSYSIDYDHSFSHHDCQAYYLRAGDSWTKIDYSKPASHWMKPLVKGQETGLVEIPANWVRQPRMLQNFPERSKEANAAQIQVLR